MLGGGKRKRIIHSTVNVRNVSGSSKKWPYLTCSCDTWIAHWYNNCLYPIPAVCPGCSKKPDSDNPWVGGHVQKVRKNEYGEYVLTNDQTIYIVPICDSCNKSDNKKFFIDKDYLVPMTAEECRADI